MAKGQATKASSGSRIKSAWRLYNAGDVVAARREAKAILVETPSAADAQQADELIERTRVPRFAWWVAAFAAGLILTMILVGIAHH